MYNHRGEAYVVNVACNIVFNQPRTATMILSAQLLKSVSVEERLRDLDPLRNLYPEVFFRGHLIHILHWPSNANILYDVMVVNIGC